MRSRAYDKEFKLNALSLLKEGKMGARQICRDLGIPESTFSGWITKYEEYGETGFPGSGRVMDSEKERLSIKKELEDVKLERDILKKALAIFSRQK